jgi:hypothetical protein
MPTVEERYKAATEYVRRAVATVEARGVAYTIDPVSGIVEWYAGKTKTAEPRHELARIEARWLRATTEDERGNIARDAELLADRVEESLPGAPQDRARTNLYKGETPKGTPATSYAQEVDNQSGEVWGWIKDRAGSFTHEAWSVGKWLLVGGGIIGGWKLLDFLRERERNRLRSASGRTQRALNASLERAAGSRNARGRSGYYVRAPDTDLYYRVVRDNGGRRVLLVPLTDEARDAIADHEVHPVTMPDGTQGEGYSADRAHYKRVSKLPRWVLQ